MKRDEVDGLLMALMLFIVVPGVIILCFWDSHSRSKECSAKHHDKPYIEKTTFLQEGEAVAKSCVTEVKKFTGECDYIDKIYVLEDCNGNAVSGTINWETCYKGNCTTYATTHP